MTGAPFRPMRHALSAIGGWICVWLPLTLPAAADAPPTLEQVLRRMHALVIEHEDDLGGLVSEEVYEQRVLDRDGATQERRVLRSQYLVFQLPPEESWFACRDVFEVDGNPVPGHRERLREMLSPDATTVDLAYKLYDESARYNIGSVVRTFNLPTFALGFFRPAYRRHLNFQKLGEERIGDANAWVIGFEEHGPPVFLATPSGKGLPVRGRVWVLPEDGRIVRTEIVAGGDRRIPDRAQVTTTFRFDPAVQLWVPDVMDERYEGRRNRGQSSVVVGHAVYSGARRIGVKGRLRPDQLPAPTGEEGSPSRDGAREGVSTAPIDTAAHVGRADAPQPGVTTVERQPTPSPADAMVMYLGGRGGDYARDIAMDPQGNMYVTGGTQSAAFPTTAGAYSREYHSTCDPGYCGTFGAMDVFVTKYSPSGQILWSTLLGGPNYDRAYGIEVAPDGSVYVAGRAGAGFPTTPGVVQPRFPAAAGSGLGAYGPQAGFAAKLSADGSQLLWATYVGASNGSTVCRDITVDSAGRPYLLLIAVGDMAPFLTKTALQREGAGGAEDAAVVLAPDATSVVYGSYLGGPGDDSAGSLLNDDLGNAIAIIYTNSTNLPTTTGQRTNAGGYDYYISKFNITTGNRIWATYYGGTGNEESDTHLGRLAPNGDVAIGGSTTSRTLPGSNAGAQPVNGGIGYDAFAARVSSDGATVIGASFAGGSANDGGEGVAVTAAGEVLIACAANSANFPVTANARQATSGGGRDGALVLFAADLRTRVYATYLGGSGDEEFRAVASAAGRIAATGSTNSTNIQVTAGAAQPIAADAGDCLIVAIPLTASPSTTSS